MRFVYKKVTEKSFSVSVPQIAFVERKCYNKTGYGEKRRLHA